jgi:muramoyltetrapeptide carboxypeptidase
VAVVAPASPPADPERIDRGLAALEDLGFKPSLARHARGRRGFLSGSDRDRAADLMRAFTDSKVRGIFCVRGGQGATRLLDRLDYRLIHANPKVFLGYSDVTALHLALGKHAGLVTFHGPMVAADFANEDLPAFTVESLRRVICRATPPGSLVEGYTGGTVFALRRGIAEGRLLGGNLTVLNTLIGTPHQPDFRGRILFLEDIDEAPYRIDRLLTHLLNAGLLQQVAGVAVGLCRNCEDARAKTAGEYRQSLRDVLKERLKPLRVPVVVGLPFGHLAHNATLPQGIHALLDGRKGDLTITEPAVL